MCKPEVWGGIECTINRVGDTWLDQLEKCGHYTRDSDIDIIAGLGIKTMRYPVLWEFHQPDENNPIDFVWANQQLHKLKSLAINPIVGLLHHGSGPAFTNLLDEKFPEKFAAFASLVAAQFPWVTHYTPINEPLTTARFSGLYGLWYPHKKNDVSYIKMLLNELKGIVLAMQAIRKINPHAQLVQTEDMGKTYSTALLSYQAKFENHRRWLTFDVLCGRMLEGHPLYKYFIRLGITPETLNFFVENPMPPDVIGVNHYITSERYLDENLDLYPEHTHGGNTLHEYADVEAIRVNHNDPNGFKIIMHEVWARYRLPIAVTEVHLHCAREEQMKWFKEIFDSATNLIGEGIQVIAVTTWSLLGAYGWNKLLTSASGEYERGAFDVSAGSVRPTAMASMIRSIVETGDFTNPLINKPGWWKSPRRFFTESTSNASHDKITDVEQPILVIGKRGTLGKAFARVCEERGLSNRLLARHEVDISDFDAIDQVIRKYKPWAIINAAGFVRVDEAEDNAMACFRDNTEGPTQLAKACRLHDIKLLTFSSDLVFDGNKNAPYIETDPVNPLNVYGKSKAESEVQVASIHPGSLIIRTSAFFGPWDKYNFISDVLKQIENGKVFKASADISISPTYVPHLVNACLDLLIDDEQGIWHVSNNASVTWYEFACKAARKAGTGEQLIEPVYNVQGRASIPRNSVLQSTKGILLPSLDKAIADFFHEVCITA